VKVRTRLTLAASGATSAECTVSSVGTGIAALLELLDLEPIEVNIFRAGTLEELTLRVFGGQVAAQALVAAGRTVGRGTVHSLHAYFLRPGDPRTPILYEVDRIRDGRSFTTRRVVAIQHGEAIFNLQASFHTSEEGIDHAAEMPSAPAPESLPTLAERAGAATPAVFVAAHGLDVRFVGELPWQRSAPASRQQLWLRTEAPIADDPLLHAAVATFASDLTLVDTILERHGYSPWDPAFIGASLDHCMWFHRPFRADEWLFYDQTSPSASAGRGLATGSLFARDGRLVASVVQEGLVRFRSRAT